jgi:hypothetical protein
MNITHIFVPSGTKDKNISDAAFWGEDILSDDITSLSEMLSAAFQDITASKELKRYTFYMRDDAGIHVLASLNFGDDISNIPIEVKRIFERTMLPDGTMFDVSKKSHWDQLPAVYNGSRLWIKIA